MTWLDQERVTYACDLCGARAASAGPCWRCNDVPPVPRAPGWNGLQDTAAWAIDTLCYQVHYAAPSGRPNDKETTT